MEARWSHVQQAHAITAFIHIEKWLNLAINQILVSQKTVSLEQVEGQLAGCRVDPDIGKNRWNVVCGVTRQFERRGGIVLIAGVVFVKQDMKTGQTLVDVLGSMRLTVVVIPNCSQRFTYITVWGCRVRKTRALHVVVVIVVLAREEESALCQRVL